MVRNFNIITSVKIKDNVNINGFKIHKKSYWSFKHVTMSTKNTLMVQNSKPCLHWKLYLPPDTQMKNLGNLIELYLQFLHGYLKSVDFIVSFSVVKMIEP